MTEISHQTLQQYIEELQAKVAFQEHMLQSLNRIVTAQDQTIMLLEGKITHVYAKLEELQNTLDQGGDVVSNDKPPHY